MQIKILSVLFAVVFLCCGCTSTQLPDDADLQIIEGPISSLNEKEGVIYLGIGPYARTFVIHPDLSPDAKSLATLAKKESKTSKKLSATIWTRADISKADPNTDEPWPWVIVNLKEAE